MPILSTPSYQGTRADLLIRIESGEIDHIDFQALVFNTNANRNHYRFNPEELHAFAASFEGKPFIRDHNEYDIESRDGTILRSFLSVNDFIQTIRLTTRKGMLSFLEGQIDRFSIGWFFDKITCSICDQDFRTCPHWPGRDYQVSHASGTRDTVTRTCEVIFSGLSGKETSAVNVPAVEGTSILANLKANPHDTGHRSPTGETRDTKARDISSRRTSGTGSHSHKENPHIQHIFSDFNSPTQSTGMNVTHSHKEIKMTEPILSATPTPVETERLAQIEANRSAAASLMGEQERMNQLNEALETSHQVLADQCAFLLQSALNSSRLPEVTQARIKRQYEGQVFQIASLQASIEEARAEIASISAGSLVQGPGRITNMATSAEQITAAVDDMLGAPRDAGQENLKAAKLSGIRELYMLTTGDFDLHGGFYAERAQLATTADFTGLVKNALNKVVAQQWAALGRAGYDWWKSIVKVERFESLNDITGILTGTVGALSTVAEQGEYTELPIGDSPETASFVKYGNYIPLTLELIDRDETRKLKQYPIELANAGIRNISKLIAAIFTDNSAVGPTMADTGALFNSTAVTTAGGHKNLLTTALSAAEWDVVAAAMYNQPMLIKNATGYYGTGSKMAVEPRFCLVPRALRKTAFDAFLNAWDVTTNVHSENLLKGNVVPLVVPEWTDATDWAAVADPAIVPGIILGERFGLMPEIFIANRETDPAVFMNDEHRLKVRHFLAVLVQDFRPLHKSNV